MMESNDRSTRNSDEAARGGQNGPNVSLILAILVVAGAITFFLQNGKDAEVTFLFFENDTTVRWAIIVALIAGIVLDRLFGFWWRRRNR